MQTIRTKWLAPTNHRGSRVKAISASGHSTVTVGWDWALGVEGNHIEAARVLAEKMAWDGSWVAGDWDGLGGYVFVNVDGPFVGFRSGAAE